MFVFIVFKVVPIALLLCQGWNSSATAATAATAATTATATAAAVRASISDAHELVIVRCTIRGDWCRENAALKCTVKTDGIGHNVLEQFSSVFFHI